MSKIKIGQEIRVSVRFLDYDFGDQADTLVDPSSVTLALYKWDGLSATPSFVLQSASLTPIVRESNGIYYYDWTPTEDGRFRLLFTGLFPGATPSTITNPRDFYIGTAVPEITLGSSYEQLFIAGLSPLYIDPERIVEFFPEVDLVEATEIIYRLSLQMTEWLGTNFTMTNLMEEYLIAATLCDLSRTYLIDGGMNGFGKTDSFSLGDLTINNGFGGGASTKKNIYRGNATSWCELAFALKNEMMVGKVSYFPVVKGSNFDNPIPKRDLRKFD